MIKILFVINTLGRGGAENALIQLIKKLDKNEYDISLYVIAGQGELIEKIPQYVHVLNKDFNTSSVLSKTGKKELKKNIIKKSFKNAAFLKNIFYIISNAFSMIYKGRIQADKLLWKMLSDAGPDIKEEFDLAVAYLEGASTYYVRDHVNAKRRVAFIHVNYIEAGYTRKLDRNAYTDFDKIFTVSEDVKSSFLSVYPECTEKTKIFDNIIDKELVIERSKEEGGFEDEFDGKRILTIARLTSQKAIDVSIEACRILIQNGENIRWYVLGEGEERKLEELIKKYNLEDRFFLLGTKDNPYTYLRQSDIYVHATRFEGKSLAIREAMILGKPIVVSDCKSNLELVNDGEDALVATLDSNELSKKISVLLHDEELCKKLGEKAGNCYSENTEDISGLLSLIIA